jgi:hypothetical protein
MNLNKIVLKKIKKFLKKTQEYSKNISPKAITKVITKVVKKQAGVVRVILFAPYMIMMEVLFIENM